jgi:hypothetical protein
LRTKVATFAEAYGRITNVRRASPRFTVVTDTALRSRFAYLDAAQLVKHYLGLANAFATGRVVLLYLSWEPANAAEYRLFAKHRHELDEFARVVSGDRVEFAYQSYP